MAIRGIFLTFRDYIPGRCCKQAASDFVVQFHRVDFLAGVRRHTVSTAETTDCAHTYHHAFGLQQKGRSTGVVGCPEGRKCALAIQSLRSLARRSFCLNIYQKYAPKESGFGPEGFR